MNRYGIGFVVCLLCNFQGSAAERLTYVDLVHRLTDLERLRSCPRPEKSVPSFRAIDRKSHYDEKSGKYLNWMQQR